MRIYLSCGLLVSLLSLTGCQSNKKNSSSKEKSTARSSISHDVSCGSTTQPVKSVRDKKGTVRYNDAEGHYSVVVTIPNTIDAQDVGIVCNLPAKLKVDGLAVTFDGDYSTYDKVPKAMLGGQAFYYLTVTKLTSEKGAV